MRTSFDMQAKSLYFDLGHHNETKATKTIEYVESEYTASSGRRT